MALISSLDNDEEMVLYGPALFPHSLQTIWDILLMQLLGTGSEQ